MTSTQPNSSRAQEIDVPYILNYRCCIHTVLIRHSFNLFISTHAVHSRNAFAIEVDGWASYSLVCSLHVSLNMNELYMCAVECISHWSDMIDCIWSGKQIASHDIMWIVPMCDTCLRKIRYNELSFLHSYIQLYRIEQKKSEQYEFLWHMHRSASSKKETSFGISYACVQQLPSNFEQEHFCPNFMVMSSDQLFHGVNINCLSVFKVTGPLGFTRTVWNVEQVNRIAFKWKELISGEKSIGQKMICVHR